MKKNIVVREIRETDYQALMEIEHSIWTKENSPIIHYYASVDEYKERREDLTIFVAADDEKVHGFIDVHHPTPLPSHKKQWMLGIGVHPNSQSLGVGKLLLDYVKEVAPKNDIHKISLRVMGSNLRAIRFYQKNNFVQEAHFVDEFFLDNKFCDDYQFAYFIPEI